VLRFLGAGHLGRSRGSTSQGIHSTSIIMDDYNSPLLGPSGVGLVTFAGIQGPSSSSPAFLMLHLILMKWLTESKGVLPTTSLPTPQEQREALRDLTIHPRITDSPTDLPWGRHNTDESHRGVHLTEKFSRSKWTAKVHCTCREPSAFFPMR
jgi:hypothetical protein